MNVIFYGTNQSQAVLIKHSSVSLSDCSLNNWSSEYGGAENIQSSNVTLCSIVVFQNNIGNYGGAMHVNESFVNNNDNTWCKFRHYWHIDVILSEPCLHGTTKFINNLARKGGGAIAVIKSNL